MTPAKLYGLGVGPGDPELITVKALRLLRSADVIAYPAPEHGDSLVRSIVSEYISEEQEELVMRMSLDPGSFPADSFYDESAARIAERLRAGRRVVSLCEGDPFFYGSFMYLFARLSDEFDVEVVPGVSSLTACPAVARAPLASRDDVLVVCPAVLEESALQRRLGETESMAIVKVGRHLAKVRRVLRNMNLEDHALYVAHATMTGEKVRPLVAVPDDSAPYFSMVLVHRRDRAWR